MQPIDQDDEEARRQQFIATISHELRTPLNAIACLVQVLASDMLVVEPTLQELQRIQHHIWQLAQVIDRLLQLLSTVPWPASAVQWMALSANEPPSGQTPTG